IAVAHVLTGLVRAARWIAALPRGAVTVASWGLLVVLNLALAGAAAFYARFGIYPRPAIVTDFLTAPAAFTGYIRSGASAKDALAFCVLAVAFAVGSTAVVRQTWREPPILHRAVWNTLLGLAL